jgi:hypothetical protein
MALLFRAAIMGPSPVFIQASDPLRDDAIEEGTDSHEEPSR